MHRPALSSSLIGILGAVIASMSAIADMQRHTPGGYRNHAHSWDGKGRKPYRGNQPRRSKAQRRARAA